MLSGATRGRGGSALARHLADTKGLNESTRPGECRGLVSDGIGAQVHELTDLAAHARSRRPLYHLHADPARQWTEPEWSIYWHDLESEFGLQAAAFSEAVHIKAGREHRHRVYSLVQPDGTCIRLDHDYARREKMSRLAELRTGEGITKGRHNRAVLAALDAAGHAAAATLRAAGIDQGDRPAAPTPKARLQEGRTGVSRTKIASDTLAAWRLSDSGAAFVAAMSDQGLPVAAGDDGPVIVDRTGSVHGLRRTLAAAAKAEGTDRITAAAVLGRLSAITLPSLEDVRHAIRDDPRCGAPAAAVPAAEPPALLQRDSTNPGTPPPPQEPTMAAPANLRPALRVVPKTEQPTELWMFSSGGVNALSSVHRQSAERSYAAWAEAKPEHGKRYDLPAYVAYVQDLHADKPAQPQGSVTARKPAKTPTRADSLRDRYAGAQADYERQQADAKKNVVKHALAAQERAYKQAWSKYSATSKRFGSPQGIIAAIIAGIILHRAEKAYMHDRRVADIDRMTTEARATEPGRRFPTSAEWLEQQAAKGDPEAVRAVRQRDDRRDRELAALAETDPRAAALARLDDAGSRVDRVLSGRPTRETDAAVTTERLVGNARTQATDAQERARQSREAAQQQWQERGSLLSAVFGGRAAQEWRVLDALAKRDEDAARSLAALLPAGLEDCRVAADRVAREGMTAVRKWESDPAVQAAGRERERLTEVRAAVLAGDRETTDAVLRQDPAGATAAAARLRLTPAAVPAADEQTADLTRGYR